MRTVICVVASVGVLAVSSALAQQTVPALPLVPAGQTQSAAAQPAAKPVYDEKADGNAQIAAAVARAHKNNSRVLIQWGGNWCGWCTMLHSTFLKDKEISHELLYEYEVVYVDTGRPEGKNMELARSYGADVKNKGFPYLTILDSGGKPLANQETSSFENKDQEATKGHDPKMVLDFLTRYQAPHVEAQKTLDAGLAEAKQSGKTAFVHFGAPWCGWCHRLEDWMARPEVASILAKDFVDIKIDQDRAPGGKEMLEKYSNGKSGGIPWYVLLDGNGKAIIDSNGDKGNIGYPGEDAEIAHFEKMLKAGAHKMTPQDITTLVKSLKDAKPGSAGGH
jgi:thiol:disulfide interchange protein